MIAILMAALAPMSAVSVRLPDVGQLVEAARARDDVEIERVAARLGPVRLQRIAERGKHDERLAALRALGVVESGWAELPGLVQLIADSDADVAEAAARTVRRIAEGLTREKMEAEDIPRDVPRRAAQALLQQAGRAELKPPLRVGAIASAAALKGVSRGDDAATMRLLSDREAQVRRAAAEALYGAGAPGAIVDRALAAVLEKDESADVAAAAGAALCRDVPATPSKAPAELRAAQLGGPARARLRALAADGKIGLADRLDLIACLRVQAKPEDKKVLDELARRGPESIKRRARSLGGR